MADRIAERFKNLERPRRPGEVDTVHEPDARIAGIEGAAPAGTAPASVAPASVERFRPPAEPSLDTVKEDDAAQPFIRCMRCETDNSPFARACSTCGADLGTREQQVFNERLWEQRKKEKELEDREAAVREKEREAEAAATEQARRAMATEMAREVAERERARMGPEYGRWGGGGSPWGGGWDRPGDPTPYGVRLLRLVKNPAWRIGAVVISVLVPLLLVVFGGRSGGARVAGMLLFVVLAALFSPPGYRYYRRRFWDW